MRRTSQKWYNMQFIDMSGKLPMGIAYPPRPLAEPRSGRYAGCERAAGEVFGCIPHGARAYRERDSFTMGADPIVFRLLSSECTGG